MAGLSNMENSYIVFTKTVANIDSEKAGVEKRDVIGKNAMKTLNDK